MKIVVVYSLFLIFSIIPLKAFATAFSCHGLFEQNYVLNDQMSSFWNKLSASEQAIVISDIELFWTRKSSNGQPLLRTSFDVFVGYVMHLFDANVKQWPVSYSSFWVKSFLTEIQHQENTTLEAKEKLKNLINLIPSE